MLLEKINIRDITDEEYTAALYLFPDIPKRGEDTKRTLAGRILLKKMIKRLYGKEDFKLYYNENGKPLCDFCYFNISHSGDYAVCAVSEREIGADIEKIKEFKKRERYMLFSAEETDYINECDSENRFFTLWTMKEAYVKAIGGRLKSAAEINLVSNKTVNTSLGGFLFKTEYFNGYVITVCEKTE